MAQSLRPGAASLELPAASREVVEDDLALIEAVEVPTDRPGLGSAPAGKV
jgi:hypothetical protein